MLQPLRNNCNRWVESINVAMMKTLLLCTDIVQRVCPLNCSSKAFATQNFLRNTFRVKITEQFIVHLVQSIAYKQAGILLSTIKGTTNRKCTSISSTNVLSMYM